MIEDYFDTTATVKRQVVSTDENGNKYTAFEEVASVFGHLQQTRAELAENMNLDFTKTFTFWCDVDENIQSGDTVLIDSEKYSVRAIKKLDIKGSNKHLEVILEKNES